MSRSILFRVARLAILVFLCNAANAQYLRDSTKFYGLSAFYPEHDTVIFNQYQEHEKHKITLDSNFSTPEIIVEINGQEYPFVFDFGNSGNISITTALADSLSFQITDTNYTYTPEGKIRGVAYDIVLEEFRTLQQTFYHESGTLSDWRIYSTSPFNGLIGLKYLKNKCFTLSYAQKILAISDNTVLTAPTSVKGDLIQLEQYQMHPFGVHFKGKVNNQDAIIYFDTGKSHSAINQNLVPSEGVITDKSGAFYKGQVRIDLGERSFTIYYPRVKNVNRNIETDLPVGIEVGSDILQYFLLTIDRTDNQNLMMIH